MNRALQVLIVEDSENDALLLQFELERAGYAPAWKRVETRETMDAALTAQPWDLVISDYSLPRFDGLRALELVRQRGLDLPFIVVSGKITDATAVAAMKAGAHDYVMKDNLARLGPAVERELREAEARRLHRQADEALKREQVFREAEHAITRLLAHAHSLAEAAPGILQALIESFQVETGALWLIQPQRQELRLALGRLGADEPPLQAFLAAGRALAFGPGAGLPGRVWQEGAALAWADLASAPELERLEAARNAGLSSAAVFPIQNAGDFLGVLEFFARRPLSPDAVQVNVMAAIGSEIGQFTRRHGAEEALRHAHEQLEIRVQERTAQLRATNASLQTAMAERARLENELLEIAEKERRRIALDLHDDLGQKLSGIALMTKGLELKLAKQASAAAPEAARIHDLVQEAMTHASGVAHDLAALDLAQKELPAALAGLAARARELFGVACRFSSQGPLPSLGAHTASQLCKIAQEAVTNAIKHGRAKRVTITLTNDSDKLTLAVRNNGKPFPDLRGQATGMGLRIMHYRANLIGAALEIKAHRAQGTLLTCALPVGAALPPGPPQPSAPHQPIKHIPREHRQGSLKLEVGQDKRG